MDSGATPQRALDAPDQVVPSVEDRSGYRLRHRDLNFLKITTADLEAWRSRSRPLGVTSVQFEGLLDDLHDVLERDGVDVADCDVRLKGSAAEFFSGPHKHMPVTREEIIDVYRGLRRRFPSEWEVIEIERRMHELWLTDSDRPAQRPFDSMYRLGVDRERSDLDFQISSDAFVTRCEKLLTDIAVDPIEARVKHGKYNFIEKDLVERAFPNLFFFTRRTAEAIGRGVSVAVFPSGGPDYCDEDPELSAHFRETDWIVRLDEPRTESAA